MNYLPTKLRTSLFLVLALTVSGFDDCSLELDGHNNPDQLGSFAVAEPVFNMWNNTRFWMYYPKPMANDGAEAFPLVIFMHGSASDQTDYQGNMIRIASHGFVVVLPLISDHDKQPLTTETDGKLILASLEFATKFANVDPKSPVRGKVDLASVALNGHSMGASDTIKAAALLSGASNVKLAIAQHPGLCGPFGPPPAPFTWSTAQLAEANKKPMVITTSENDNAFGPWTPKSEEGCFSKGANGTSIFVKFTAASCIGGHTCPQKYTYPEGSWVTTILKLYLQQGGSKTSQCYNMVWGDDKTMSLKNDHNVSKAIFNL